MLLLRKSKEASVMGAERLARKKVGKVKRANQIKSCKSL